jgi:hypothetical protein
MITAKIPEHKGAKINGKVERKLNSVVSGKNLSFGLLNIPDEAEPIANPRNHKATKSITLFISRLGLKKLSIVSFNIPIEQLENPYYS